MGNMSYCRFENTLSDLRDCADHMDDKDDFDEDSDNDNMLSESETEAKRKLIELCSQIASDYS